MKKKLFFSNLNPFQKCRSKRPFANALLCRLSIVDTRGGAPTDRQAAPADTIGTWLGRRDATSGSKTESGRKAVVVVVIVVADAFRCYEVTSFPDDGDVELIAMSENGLYYGAENEVVGQAI